MQDFMDMTEIEEHVDQAAKGDEREPARDYIDPDGHMRDCTDRGVSAPNRGCGVLDLRTPRAVGLPGPGVVL